MNERIKQLMGQTLDEKFAGTWSVMDLQDLTKFADRFSELIVKECITQCEQVATDANAMTKSKFVTDAGLVLHEGAWGGAKNCSEQIKQHFGVEE
jgi:hypothetical protein